MIESAKRQNTFWRSVLLEERKNKSVGCLVARMPKAIADNVLRWGKRIPSSRLVEALDKSPPHITVKWGIKSPVNEVRKAVANAPVNTLWCELQNITLFENEEADVLKVDVKSLDCHTMFGYATGKLDCVPPTHDEYIPHMTLAYVQSGWGKFYLPVSKVDNPFLGEHVMLKNLVYCDPQDKEHICPLPNK